VLRGVVGERRKFGQRLDRPYADADEERLTPPLVSSKAQENLKTVPFATENVQSNATRTSPKGLRM
jgi:hypothetical protein